MARTVGMSTEARQLGTATLRLWHVGLLSRANTHALVLSGLAVIAISLYFPMFRPGLPPGADAPTFLHFSWFAEKTLQGSGGLVDPFWYGGFPLFKAYPPLSYMLVALLDYATPMGLVLAYKVALFAAYLGLGMATYWLALELRLGVMASTVAAVLTVTAYPVFSAFALSGWFASVVALPLGIASLAALERAVRCHSPRFALLGGALLGLSALSNHMAAFAFALVFVVWCAVRFLTVREERRSQIVASGVFAVSAAAVSLWWLVPSLSHLVGTGFRREVPGLFSFSFGEYAWAAMNKDLVGVLTYPSYIGPILAPAIGGIVLSVLARGRVTAYAAAAVALWAFSLGAQMNPLLRLRPLDGLDVARFQLFLVPFAAVAGAFFLGQLWSNWRQFSQAPPLHRIARMLCLGMLALVLASSVYYAVHASRAVLRPVSLKPAAYGALEWLRDETPAGSKVLAVGWWNWDAYLVPSETGRAVMDGWHDEGAQDWRDIRQVRLMMWSGVVDLPRLYQVMSQRATDYVMLYDYYHGENPRAFRDALRSRADLYREEIAGEDVSVFRRNKELGTGN